MKQHKEFAGHTGSSLSSVYRNIIVCLKKRGHKSEVVSPLEVARFAAKTFQPAKDTTTKVAHKERVIHHFKKRVKELEINVVV